MYSYYYEQKNIIIGVIIITMFIMLAIVPSVAQQTQNNVKSDSTCEGSCSGCYYVTDIFGAKVLKADFSASWLYSSQNGNLVYEYTPTSTAHSIIPVISWVKVDKPQWANPSQNKYVAYGNIVYRLGVWYFALPEYYHATVTVGPNSYGYGTMCVGSGEYD